MSVDSTAYNLTHIFRDPGDYCFSVQAENAINLGGTSTTRSRCGPPVSDSLPLLPAETGRPCHLHQSPLVPGGHQQPIPLLLESSVALPAQSTPVLTTHSATTNLLLAIITAPAPIPAL